VRVSLLKNTEEPCQGLRVQSGRGISAFVTALLWPWHEGGLTRLPRSVASLPLINHCRDESKALRWRHPRRSSPLPCCGQTGPARESSASGLFYPISRSSTRVPAGKCSPACIAKARARTKRRSPSRCLASISRSLSIPGGVERARTAD